MLLVYAASLSCFGLTGAKRLGQVRHCALVSKEVSVQQLSGVYDPEDLSLLGKIFDEAIAALPASMRTPENRAAIAKLILQRAAAGQAGLASLMSLMGVIASAA